MSAKNAVKFKKPEDYPQGGQAVDNHQPLRETFFRLKLMPAGLIQYAVEQITVLDGVVVDRSVVTERDILAITMSKIEDRLLREIRR